MLAGPAGCAGRRQAAPSQAAATTGEDDQRDRAPILDTHIHLYEVSRAGGVPWPRPEQKLLYRDTRAEDYEAVARPLGIVGAGVVEASNLAQDTRWVLDHVSQRPFFRFYVAQLPIGAPDFPQQLEEITRDERVVGIRGFLWSPQLTLEPRQLEHLRLLAARGLSLDLVSRRTLNPKRRVAELAAAVPELRIIIDHLGGALGGPLDRAWAEEMRTLSRHPNVHVKLSSLFDMWNPASSEIEPWSSPKDAADYRPQVELLLQVFGPDRVIWGSNWPVCNLGGSLAEQVRVTEALLAPHGRDVRDRVMYRNAEKFYRRQPAPH